jgi:hypothetical protein
MLPNFKPRPAVIAPPQVVIPAKRRLPGEVDEAAVAATITEEKYAEQVRKGEERARYRPR